MHDNAGMTVAKMIGVFPLWPLPPLSALFPSTAASLPPPPPLAIALDVATDEALEAATVASIVEVPWPLAK